MSPRTERQNKAIRKKVESKILESALELFASEGYDGTSMQMIALKSDVSKGNLYNYFNSKQDLLEGVLISGLNKISNSYNNYADKLISEDEFEYLIRGNFKIIGKNRNFWRLYFNLVAQPKVQELFKKVFSPFLEQYFAVFELYYKNRGDKGSQYLCFIVG